MQTKDFFFLFSTFSIPFHFHSPKVCLPALLIHLTWILFGLPISAKISLSGFDHLSFSLCYILYGAGLNLSLNTLNCVFQLNKT